MSIAHDDVLSEEDLAEIEGITAESAIPPETPPSRLVERIKIVQATDEQCESAIESLLSDFPGLVSSKSSHWSLTLISILVKIGYRPKRTILANQKDYDGIDGRDYMKFVQRHISIQALHDIRSQIVIWADDNPSALVAEDMEGAVIIETEDGGMAYQDKAPEVEKAGSETQEGWASW